MENQQFTVAELTDAAKIGEKSASEALSQLSGLEVKVSTEEAKPVRGEAVKEAFTSLTEHAVVAYTQAIEGLSGVSVLALDRADALTLVDLFNKREKGTTVVMQDIDRSTIKETLNILANAYVQSLANSAQITIRLDVPLMITKDKMHELHEQVVTDENAGAVLFNAGLSVADADFNVRLLFFFLTVTPE